MSLQKLRTPKGLLELSRQANTSDKNTTLVLMQELYDIYCATWSEGIWCILDASASPTKFILSDHPVTVYNKGCFPGSRHCRDHRDPDIRCVGTHTLFPLSLNKLLVITNKPWIHSPYGDPLRLRPNPKLRRSTMFSFLDIQVQRLLSEVEVAEVNFVLKERAFRFVAAAEKEWLFPEPSISTQFWDQLGDGYLFMPDPRGLAFTSEMHMLYSDGTKDAIDSYGRRPGEAGYAEMPSEQEQHAALAFKGEFARRFGPRRRGRAFEGNELEREEDSPDFHAWHLQLEAKYKALLPKRKR